MNVTGSMTARLMLRQFATTPPVLTNVFVHLVISGLTDSALILTNVWTLPYTPAPEPTLFARIPLAHTTASAMLATLTMVLAVRTSMNVLVSSKTSLFFQK